MTCSGQVFYKYGTILIPESQPSFS